MEHHFNVEVAEKYGMLEAVLLNHFHFWIKKNEANDRNYHDGHYWTYNSTRALHKLFPYVTERKIRYAIKHLENEGLLVTGNYNASAYDRTTWYALTEMAMSILQKRQMETAETSSQTDRTAKPIPDNKPVKNTNNNHIYEDVPEELKEAFAEWAEMRKSIKRPITSKQTVKRALNKLNTLSKDTKKQIELIQIATDKCWLSFYPDTKKASDKPEPPKYRQFEPDPKIDKSPMPEEMRAKYRGYINEL